MQGVEGTVEPGQRVRWRPQRTFAGSRFAPRDSGRRNSSARIYPTPNGRGEKTSNDAPNFWNRGAIWGTSTVGRAAAIDRMTGREYRTIEPFSCLKHSLRRRSRATIISKQSPSRLSAEKRTVLPYLSNFVVRPRNFIWAVRKISRLIVDRHLGIFGRVIACRTHMLWTRPGRGSDAFVTA
jgi:hypothetical protein